MNPRCIVIGVFVMEEYLFCGWFLPCRIRFHLDVNIELKICGFNNVSGLDLGFLDNKDRGFHDFNYSSEYSVFSNKGGKIKITIK